MEQESEKFRLTCVAASILDWYRHGVMDVEEEIEDDGQSWVGYPYYDRENLKGEWKFWTGREPNENDPIEIRVFDKLYNLISVLNDLEGHQNINV